MKGSLLHKAAFDLLFITLKTGYFGAGLKTYLSIKVTGA
jgi:hypothetical protein